MRRKLLSEQELIERTKDVVSRYYGANAEHAEDFLTEDFSWIGAFSFQYATNKQEFLALIANEYDAIPFVILNEEYAVILKSPSLYVIAAKIHLVARNEQDQPIHTDTRLTIIWKFDKDVLKLFHIHGSNSQDVPLLMDAPMVDARTTQNFFQYVSAVGNSEMGTKRAFREVSGGYRYLYENQIIYMEANLQSTIIHTHHESIEVSGLLMNNAKKVSNHFYRVHKSYLINSSLVQALERYTVTLCDGIQVPISKDKFMAFRKFLHEEQE